MGNGSESKSCKTGDIKGLIVSSNKKKAKHAVIKNVAYSPSATCNLFSLTCMTKKGWTLIGNDKGITISKNGTHIKFDTKVKTKRGYLFIMKFVRLDEGDESTMNVQDDNPVPIIKAHKIMTHCGEDDTRLTFKYLGIPISRGSLPDCVDCALAKAKRKALPKTTQFVKKIEEVKPVKKGLVSLDLSKLTFKIEGKPVVLTNPNWRLLVDHKSQLAFPTFHSTKNGMIEPTCSQINTWIKTGHDITTI